MTTVNKYRVYCNTESTYQTVWAETEPFTCPINTNHVIDQSKTSIIGGIDESLTKIKEEYKLTQDNFQCKSIVINAAPNTTSHTDIIWEYPISVYALSFITEERHKNDIINIQLSPDTIIGAVAYPTAPGNKTFYVTDTVLLFINMGYHVKITDGVNQDDLGRVISIDKANSTITTEYACQNMYSPYSPTYVRMTIYFIENFVIGPPWEYVVGKKKIGGAHLPANVIIRACYTNLTNETKDVIANFEYTY